MRTGTQDIRSQACLYAFEFQTMPTHHRAVYALARVTLQPYDPSNRGVQLNIGEYDRSAYKHSAVQKSQLDESMRSSNPTNPPPQSVLLHAIHIHDVAFVKPDVLPPKNQSSLFSIIFFPPYLTIAQVRSYPQADRVCAGCLPKLCVLYTIAMPIVQ